MPIIISIPLSLKHDISDKEIEFYKARQRTLVQMMHYQGIINNPILLMLSLYVLFKILCVRQRKEMFLVVIPILLIIQSLWWSIENLGQLFFGLIYENYIVVDSIVDGLYSFSHWIFAAQYLRTSFLLPEMFKQSLLKVQMGLFEQSKTEASETDKIMNRLSRE